MFTDEEITLDEEVFKALEVLKLLHSRLGKGVAYLDAGFVYAPYIPLQITNVINTNDIRSIKTLCKK